MRLVAADAVARQADTLITAGGVQSNHARVTAAAAAQLGLRAILVVSGQRPAVSRRGTRANALLDRLLGAEIIAVESREDRTAAMEAAADRRARRRPPALRHPDRRLDAARCGRLRPRCRRAAGADSASRRHHPRLVVGRHAGRARRRLRPRRRQDAGRRHQRRRAARGADGGDPAHPRRPRRSDRHRSRTVRRRRRHRRRRLRRRRLRHSVAGRPRGARTAGADRSALSRSHLHGQGDGRPDRLRSPRRVSAATRSVLFWHTGGQVAFSRKRANETHEADVPRSRADGDRLEAPARHRLGQGARRWRPLSGAEGAARAQLAAASGRAVGASTPSS